MAEVVKRFMDKKTTDGSDVTLVVDLDGTLIRSDMLLEQLVALSREGMPGLQKLMQARPGNRAALKKALSALCAFDPALLPFNPKVIEEIEAWRADGGRVALVTASDQQVADCIAAHLGLFDEVFGSDGETNLKGEEKARFLVSRYGVGGFDYIGDSRADLACWREARRALVVNRRAGFQRKVQAVKAFGPDELVIVGAANRGSFRSEIGPYIKALRPHQWLKNLLLFLPLAAGHRFAAEGWLLALIGFFSFNAVASGIYIINDLVDLPSDRAHQRKRLRPFASGAVPVSQGVVLSAALLMLGVVLGLLLPVEFLMVLIGYILLTSAYTFHLKRLMMIDVSVLATLYAVRVVAGGAATGVPLSFWLLAFCIFLFLSLASTKRQAELVDSPLPEDQQLPGRAYTKRDLPVFSMMSLSAGYMAVLVLMLYLNSDNVNELYSAPQYLWLICPVFLYWVSRVALLTQRGQMHDDPVVFALKDVTSYVCAGVILLILFISSAS